MRVSTTTTFDVIHHTALKDQLRHVRAKFLTLLRSVIALSVFTLFAVNVTAQCTNGFSTTGVIASKAVGGSVTKQWYVCLPIYVGN